MTQSPIIPFELDYLPGNPSPLSSEDLLNFSAEADDTQHEYSTAALPIVQQTFQFNITATPATNGQLRAISIGFNAKACMVDNATGQWFWSPQMNQWIAPFLSGIIRNFVGGTQTIDFVPMTPVGQTSTPQNGQFLSFTVYSINLSPDSGILLSAGAISATVNQGTPNGGGGQAWPVTVTSLPSLTINPQPLTPYFNAAVTNVVQSMRGVASKLGYIDVINPNAVDVFIQIFDAVNPAAVTLGTTTPTLSLMCPAGGGAFASAGGRDVPWPEPINFANGIQIAVTTGPTNAVAAGTASVVNGGYF